MKLYATTTSDKHGREAKKGGDEYITVRFQNGNISCFEVTFFPDNDKRGTLEIMRYDGYDNIVIVPYRGQVETSFRNSDNDTRTA